MPNLWDNTLTLPVFPTSTLKGLTFPVVRTPQWDTNSFTSVTGVRRTLGRFIVPLYRFQLTFSFLRMASAYLEYQTLLSFFNEVGGKRDIFQFKDPYDYTVTAQTFGTGDGTTTDFQLRRTVSGVYAYDDPVFDPIGIADLTINGVSQPYPANWTINNIGTITFTSAPAVADVLAWTGTFDWFCRFDLDTSQFDQFMYNLFELKTLTFLSTKI